MALGGLADFTLQTSISGGAGIVSGGANVIPKLVVKVWDLWCEGKIEEAMKLQDVLSRGNWLLGRPGVPGTKAALQRFSGHGGFARRPLKRFGESGIKRLAEDLEEIIKVENGL
jgi:L-threo-3-deoxy-hexylosonate aldolase